MACSTVCGAFHAYADGISAMQASETVPLFLKKAGKKLKQAEWILCPVCGSKTRSRIREDTILINYPLYCPKCRQERLIEVKNLHVTVVGNEWKNDI